MQDNKRTLATRIVLAGASIESPNAAENGFKERPGYQKCKLARVQFTSGGTSLQQLTFLVAGFARRAERAFRTFCIGLCVCEWDDAKNTAGGILTKR